jgi:hypothetical protein
MKGFEDTHAPDPLQDWFEREWRALPSDERDEVSRAHLSLYINPEARAAAAKDYLMVMYLGRHTLDGDVTVEQLVA